MHSSCSGYSSINPNTKYQIVEYFDFLFCSVWLKIRLTMWPLAWCGKKNIWLPIRFSFCFYHCSEFCLYFLVLAWNGHNLVHRQSKLKHIFIYLVGVQTECDIYLIGAQTECDCTIVNWWLHINIWCLNLHPHPTLNETATLSCSL